MSNKWVIKINRTFTGATFSKPPKPGHMGWQVQMYLWCAWKRLFDKDWPRNIGTYGHPNNLLFFLFHTVSLKDNCWFALKKK